MKCNHLTTNATDMTKTTFEEFKVTGNQLLSRVKKLIQEGNVRRVIVKDPKGKTLVETPLTFGVAGMSGLLVLAPFLSAVAAVAILISDASVIVERYENENGDEHEIRQDYIEIDVEEDDKT